MTKPRLRESRHAANGPFIDEQQKCRRMLAQLEALSDACFNVDPDKNRDWGEVGSLKHLNTLLAQALEFYGVKT